MLADHSTPAVPMSKVIANELEILGSHGMQTHRYGAMLAMIKSGKLAPEKLIGRRITLEESVQALINMDKFEGVGVAGAASEVGYVQLDGVALADPVKAANTLL